MTRVELRGVTKSFKGQVVVDNVSFTVESGEFFVILGPSGSGKTTTLRIIAGFVEPDSGAILFDGEDVTRARPYERGTAMVFQNYALWPHMTVFDNIAFGLKIKKVPWEEIKRRVKWALELVRLEGYEDRYPHQLSGGQQQRVALARALVVEPRVLLLDEPLSNLDAKLRVEMREELKRLQRRLGITTIYVTHDQVEAMTMADRVAVLNRGRVLQVGTPMDLYFNPANLFVASFVGRNNIFPCRILSLGEGTAEVEVPALNARLRGVPMGRLAEGSRAYVAIRPEFLRLHPPREGEYHVLEATLEMAMFRGDRIEARFTMATGESLVAFLDPEERVRQGAQYRLYVKQANIRILPEPREPHEMPD